MFTIKDVRVHDIIYINSLTLEGDTITCILGQSGSGKSTFLRLLNNLDTPDEGEISYLGKPFQRIDAVELRRKITMLPQIPVIFEGTLRDNLLIGLKFTEKEFPDDQELYDVLHEMQLSKNLDTDAADLSGGEKQRLALARIILMDAEVYLLDEPSSALDSTTRDNVIHAFLNHAKKHHKAVIMVTHDEVLAEQVGDVIIHMEQYSIAKKE